MADVTRTIHVRVLTFDPVQGQRIPVVNAGLLVEDRGWLWNPDLSDGSSTTDADGRATVDVTFAEEKENALNPFFTITVPAADRTLPASAPPDHQFELPAKWTTRHYVRRRIPRITDHTTPARPLEIFVGLEADIRVGYTDFDSSGLGNLFALPEDTPRVHLADYDHFLWIDWLNPDDVMLGPGFDAARGRVVRAGEGDRYPYSDEPPTAPSALEGEVTGPRAWIDPPGAPVGWLGGGSFENVGPLAIDLHAFVFVVDGNAVHRFYPDGTLCETITGFSAPGGLAVDQYRNLFVADTGNNRVVAHRLNSLDGGSGRYVRVGAVGVGGSGVGQFRRPLGMAVVPQRVADGDELLAVADADNDRVQVFRIEITPGTANRANRAQTSYSLGLRHLTSFGTTGSAAGEFQEPVGVAADRSRRLFVCDRTLHRVSRWALDASGAAYAHEADWEASGGGSGAGEGQFDTPAAVTIDWTNGHLYVAEEGNGRVQRLDAESGGHLCFWEHTYDPALAQPFVPAAIAADSRGELYAADAGNRRIVRASAFDIAGAPPGDGDEPRPVGAPWTPRDDPAHMRDPGYVFFDDQDRLWVSDTGNDRVQRYERNSAGELVPAGDPLADGLSRPVGIVSDPDNNLFVVDSGNHRVVVHDAALAPQTALGARGSGDEEFQDPRGIAIAQRTEPVLYVADRGNDRIQYLRRGGSFDGRLTSGGGTPFSGPEDVAVDSTGAVTVADTRNGRIVRFVVDDDGNHFFDREFALPLRRTGVSPRPCGISVDDRDNLLVTDRAQEIVFLLEADGDLLAYWDLRALLQLDIGPPPVEYHPELARMTVFDRPARAALDSRGLLAVADTGRSRVRLIRISTRIRANLFDLGERLPDISFRAITRNDWRDSVGLRLKVGNVSLFDESHDLKTAPEDDFSGDHYEHRQIIKQSKSTNAAINVMKTARTVQRWFREHTREDEAEGRWGSPENARRLNVDLISSEGSYQFLDVNLGEKSPHGRGSDAWDEPLIAHEMTHWIFFRAVRPRPPFSLFGLIELARSHNLAVISSYNQALSEGWANYVEAFWGSEFCSTDRVRGYPLAPHQGLRNIYPRNGAYQYLFGGPASAASPSFDDPQKGQQNEGYFANSLYQLHCALTDPGRLFADSPAFWHFYNTAVGEDQSRRYSETIWRALRRFPNEPTLEELDRASRVYLVNILHQFHAEHPAFAQLARSIFELNNQLMPKITITEGSSDSSPGSAIGPTVWLAPGAQRELIVQVRDATGAPIRGYNLRFAVADAANYTLRAGSGPAIRHGRRPDPAAPPSTTELWRATNASGIVNVEFTAPAQPGTTQTMTVSYQPDFDTDDTFAPPAKGDDRETVLRRLYLYELRAAAKTWAGTGGNYGARVERSLTWEIGGS